MKLPSSKLTDFNHIREWLTPLLEERSVSVEELANQVGVTRAAIYHYMKDTTRPTEQTMIKMCQVLSVDPEVGLGKYTPKRNGRPPR